MTNQTIPFGKLLCGVRDDLPMDQRLDTDVFDAFAVAYMLALRDALENVDLASDDVQNVIIERWNACAATFGGQ